MGKLNQIIAIEKGIKSRTTEVLSAAYKAVQKPDLFNGFIKTYEKLDEADAELPPESKRVQFHADEMLRVFERASSELIDVTARKDWSNCVAKGDVYVDDVAVLTGVPVSHLLFLEKMLTDMRAYVGHMPILAEDEDWTKDVNSGLFKTPAKKTHRTKKVAKPIVLYPATPEHPAQTQMAAEDVVAGYWVLINHSGAMPKTDKAALSARLEKLIIAVKEAREAANMQDEVTLPSVADKIFGYLLPR